MSIGEGNLQDLQGGEPTYGDDSPFTVQGGGVADTAKGVVLGALDKGCKHIVAFVILLVIGVLLIIFMWSPGVFGVTFSDNAKGLWMTGAIITIVVSMAVGANCVLNKKKQGEN